MTLHERFQNLLATKPALDDLVSFARIVRDEGYSQAEVYQLFDQFRAKHENDCNQAIYDTLLDAMDFVRGFCQPSSQIFKHPDDKS